MPAHVAENFQVTILVKYALILLIVMKNLIAFQQSYPVVSLNTMRNKISIPRAIIRRYLYASPGRYHRTGFIASDIIYSSNSKDDIISDVTTKRKKIPKIEVLDKDVNTCQAKEIILVIVESPAKAKTIQKFLENTPTEEYIVDFCAGHIRDFPTAAVTSRGKKKEMISDCLKLNVGTVLRNYISWQYITYYCRYFII